MQLIGQQVIILELIRSVWCIEVNKIFKNCCYIYHTSFIFNVDKQDELVFLNMYKLVEHMTSIKGRFIVTFIEHRKFILVTRKESPQKIFPVLSWQTS